jgi:hypothetical protein
MKKIKILALFVLLAIITACSTGNNTLSDTNNRQDTSNDKTAKSLVVYFSQTGSTKKLAEFIAKETKADLFELKPTPAYSNADIDWTDENSRVVKEHNNMPNVEVKLENTKVPNFESYDKVFIGAPIWWGELSWVVDDFVKSNDFKGKKLVAFSTSLSSGNSESGKRLEGYTKDVQWLKGERFSSNFNEDDVKKWLETLN